MPTDAQISVAEELIVVLKAFHDATEIISGEKYPTIGIVKPLQKKLEVTLVTKKDDSSLVKQIKGVIQKDIGQCYQNEEISTLLKVAMFLEPRFKEMPFLNRAEKQQVKEIVKFELQRFIEQTEELHVEDADVPTTLPESESSYQPAKKKKMELFVTGFWKTDRNVTLGQLHFLGPANSPTHILSMHCCNTRLSFLVYFSRADFADHVKL